MGLYQNQEPHTPTLLSQGHITIAFFPQMSTSSLTSRPNPHLIPIKSRPHLLTDKISENFPAKSLTRTNHPRYPTPRCFVPCPCCYLKFLSNLVPRVSPLLAPGDRKRRDHENEVDFCLGGLKHVWKNRISLAFNFRSRSNY